MTVTATFFQIRFASETTYDPDLGVDTAGPPSRRYGFEVNTTYLPFRWLEFYTSVASTHARYTQDYNDGAGHVGRHIPEAPNLIANVAGYVRNLGHGRAASNGATSASFRSRPIMPLPAKDTERSTSRAITPFRAA